MTMTDHIPSDIIWIEIETVDTHIDLLDPSTRDIYAYQAMYYIAAAENGTSSETDQDSSDVTDLDTYDVIADYWDDSLRLVRIDSRSRLASILAHGETSPDRIASAICAMARSAYLAGDGYIYISHGIGYDWIDMDILGGSGDGQTRRQLEESISITMKIID